MLPERWTGNRSLFGEFDKLFNFEPFVSANNWGLARANPTFTAHLDTIEHDDSYVLKMDLPGMSIEDVKIELRDNKLTISGERKQEIVNEASGVTRLERSYGRFSRSVYIPETIDADDIEATLTNGVLSVTLPKTEVSEPEVKTIRINE